MSDLYYECAARVVYSKYHEWAYRNRFVPWRDILNPQNHRAISKTTMQ